MSMTSNRLPGSRGSALLEVLITMVILAVGLLGLAGLQARVMVLESESYQRAQAIVIMNDMAERISANRANAASYITGAPLGHCDKPCVQAAVEDCVALGYTGVQLDLCEWGNALKGSGVMADDSPGAAQVGAMAEAKACLSSFTATATKAFNRCQTGVQIDVVWRGRSSTVTPASACGASDSEYSALDGKAGFRRAVSTRVGTGDTAC